MSILLKKRKYIKEVINDFNIIVIIYLLILMLIINSIILLLF